jgi:phospholipase/carboxylesterase
MSRPAHSACAAGRFFRRRSSGWFAAFALIALGSACRRAPAEPDPPRVASAPSAHARAPRPAALPPANAAPIASPDVERHAAGLSYVELLTGNAQEDQTLPLIVALHGLGDDPRSFAGVFLGFTSSARVVLPQGPVKFQDGYSWFDFRGPGADVDAQARAIRRATDAIARAVVQIEKDHPTQGKAIVTGFSEGGVLSYALAALHPGLIAAAYPVSGWLPSPLVDRAPRSGPRPALVALHGDSDPLIALDAARASVSALKQRGYAASLQVFHGVGHRLAPAVHQRLFELLAGACKDAED